MLFNAVKATIFISAVDFASSAATSQHESLSAAKRHYVSPPTNGCSLAQGYCDRYTRDPSPDRDDADDFYVQHRSGFASQGSASSGSGSQGIASSGVTAYGAAGVSQGSAGIAVTGVEAMVGGWASLTPIFQQFQSTISAEVSVDVAVRAAISLGAQIQLVSRRYGSCGCSPSSETSSAFQSMAVQFFLQMQSALQVCHQRFGFAWESHLKSVFKQYSIAIVSLKAIAASIQVNLAAALQLAGINIQLFAAVGLNLSVLLQLNLTGGFLHDKLPLM